MILKSFRRLRSATYTMTLSFPNQSRFYDATRRAVRFWGHDSAMEASFFVNADALKRIKPDMRFDEVSAQYAEFGDFYVGEIVRPPEWVERLP